MCGVEMASRKIQTYQNKAKNLCTIWGYHFYFVDSNQASSNSVIPVSSWHVCLFWSPRRRQTAMMYRPIELKDGMFQLSTFGGAGNVYSKLQATKTAL